VGHAEIGERGAPVRLHEDVAGLDVAVDRPPRVRVVEGVGDGVQDGQGLLHRQRAAHAQHLLEVRAFQVLHDDVVGADVVDRDDVRMRQVPRRLRLAQEPRTAVLAAPRREVEAQDLEGHVALGEGIVGAVDLRHRSLPDEGLDDVAAELDLRRTLAEIQERGERGSVDTQRDRPRYDADHEHSDPDVGTSGSR